MFKTKFKTQKIDGTLIQLKMTKAATLSSNILIKKPVHTISGGTPDTSSRQHWELLL